MITDYDIPSAISKIFQVNEVKRQFMNIYFHAKLRRSLSFTYSGKITAFDR
ncbi:hypothetical protein [Nostoc sp.]|uniref:hypothetical protein n=1 Tax=Nostoc sp. TaxID=1180 RepID=UPI002FF81317